MWIAGLKGIQLRRKVRRGIVIIKTPRGAHLFAHSPIYAVIQDLQQRLKSNHSSPKLLTTVHCVHFMPLA